MAVLKPKDLWACLFWLITINLSCLSVQSYYKTKRLILRQYPSKVIGVLNVHFGDFLIFPLFWSPQDFKLLWRSSNTKCWKCWTHRPQHQHGVQLCLLASIAILLLIGFLLLVWNYETHPQYQVRQSSICAFKQIALKFLYTRVKAILQTTKSKPGSYWSLQHVVKMRTQGSTV